VRHVMSRFFGNSREQLLLTLLGDEEISAGELERLKEVIRNAAPDADAAALTEPVRPAHHGLGRNRKEKV
jgi:hypothetical protein